MLAVLPGTHSKWAIVERGRLAEFATFMTGELYARAARAQHPRPDGGRVRRNGGPAGEAFARGVARGSAGDGLAHAIFGARTLALAGDLAPEDVGDWLSGVLIGDEIRAARDGRRIAASTRTSVRVIGDGALVARYTSRAGSDWASRAEAGPAAAAALGLYRIAQHAGLLIAR